MTQETERTSLPKGVDVTPTPFLQCGKPGSLDVEISNPTTKPVMLQTLATLYELHQVELAEGDESEQRLEKSSDEYFKLFDMDLTGLTEDQVHAAKKILWDYRDVFSRDDMDIGLTTLVKHHIQMSYDTAFRQQHRHILPSMYREVRVHLQQLLDAEIIS